MPLPRDVRRKLSRLGKQGEEQGEEGQEAGRQVPESSAEACPEAADRASVPRPLGDVTRERLKSRVAGLGAEQPKAAPDTWRPKGGAPVPLELCVPGEVLGNELGTLYVVRRREAEVSQHPSPVSGFLEVFARHAPASHEEFASLAEAQPEGVVFLDTETAGLQSVPLFLCGIMQCRAGEFWIEQMLARDYTEEPALLQHVHDSVARAEVLVTYNGRTFDVPFIHDRMAYHLMEARIETEHVDLLPHARRRFREVLPDCKLQTLEREICKRPRSLGDIPGEEIPQAYHDFVASGDGRLLQPIFEHNALDLVALADVLVRLAEA